MRNRRLLTLAVLAVALGFSAFAYAADTAVVTLIQDPTATGGAGTFDLRLSVFEGDSLGTTSTSLGVVDFAVKLVYPTGDLVIDTVTNESPYGAVTNDGGTTVDGAGFTGVDNIGLRGVGQDPNWRPVGLQPVAYNSAGTNDALRDAGFLPGVGTVGDSAISLPGGTTFVGTAPAYDADTRIAAGTYHNTGAGGTLGVETFGTVSVDTLRGMSSFVGPTSESAGDPNTFGTQVQGIVIQTTSGAGNDGGRSIAQNATNLTVEYGSAMLGSDFHSGQQSDGGANHTMANVTVNVTEPDTSVTLGSFQVLAGLNIQDNAGTQKVDVSHYTAALYAADLNQAEADALANIHLGETSGGTEGIVSSDTRLGSGMSLGFAPKTDLDSLNYLEVGLAKTGDTNFDGAVDGADLANVSVYWDPAGASGQTKWYHGDLNLDGAIDGADLALISVWWNPAGNPIPFGVGQVPEPATLGLLAVGALGLIRRRRRAA